MSDSLLILGRQPALGLAELEALYGAANVETIGDQAARVFLPSDQIDFKRLGGSLKAARILNVLDTTNWGDIEKYLIKTTPAHALLLPTGKLTIGLSVYGLKETPARINATGLSIKKAIRKLSDRSVRLVPNNEPALNTAQTLHNRLTDERNWELIFVSDGSQTILAQATAVQDIDGYTLRDRERPKRDAKVGMLPPKLAQTLINLTNPAAGATILDPFCGTGVILQEALLMGYNAYGTDLEERMIDYTGENLDWLNEKFELPDVSMRIETGDATNTKWEPGFTAVAAETYLGRPFTERPAPDVLNQTVTDCNLIIKKFLRNLATQTKPGFSLCIAVPAWITGKDSFKHLPLIDQISEIGYNRVRFEHAADSDLIYYRENQFTARELLVLTRK